MSSPNISMLGPALQGLMGTARFARPIVSYNGADVNVQVYPSLKELTYKEGTEQTGDNIEMRLADPEGHFRLTWTLKGATPLSLGLESQNWNYPGEHLYKDCGTFELHRISIKKSKKSGSEVTLYASSIPVKSSLRLERKTRAWTKTDLKTIAQQVATENGLTLQYIAKENPQIARSEQHDESDFVLLNRHGEENDLFVKVKRGALWIISKEELEQQSPVGTIICDTPLSQGGINGRGLIEWEIEESTEDTYKGCEVKHRNNKTGTTAIGSTTDPDAVVGATLRDKSNHHPPPSEDTND